MIQWLLKALGIPDEPTPGSVLASTPVPERAAPSLAQEALLCSIEPSRGRLWDTASYAVAAALLLELSREGRLEVSGTGRKTRVTVLDAHPFGNHELDRSLALLAAAQPGSRLTRDVPLLPGAQMMATRLVSRGLIHEETHRRLGLLTARRLNPTPAAGRDAVVSRVRSALLGESLPDDRTALLISVFEVGVPVRFFVPRGRTREADRRAVDIREGIGADGRALLSAVIAVQDKNSGDYSSGV